MKSRNNMRKALFSLIFPFLIQEISSNECGWAYRVERFLIEQDAMEGSWPWMVSIMKVGRDGEYIQSCSGSMITNKHVLTAAHCLDNNNLSLFKVKIGSVDERLGQEYNITRIVTHNTYVSGLYNGDVAILTLEKNVDSKDFNPVCLPTSPEFSNLTGQYTTVVGWGLTKPSGPSYPKLREKFGLVVISNSRCNQFILANNFTNTFPQGVADGMICTVSANECVGSSGSPLMYQVEDQWYVVGVKSFGWSCEEPDFPTGYIRVTEYSDWISKNIMLGCGWSNKISDSTKNGAASEGTWPWMVAIQLKNRQGLFDHLCSGSMISKKHVLTSAHCFRNNDTSLYKARIGNVDERLAQEYNITRIIIHEGYTLGRFYDDIAILTLEREIDLENFNPVCLPPHREFINLTGNNTAVVGWEQSISTVEKYPMLREDFGVVVISNTRCNDIFSRMSRFKRIFNHGLTDGIICTYYTKECLGDSGSPFMYQTEGKWYVVGLSSFGMGCGRPDYPLGYTKVSEYLEWIERNTKN